VCQGVRELLRIARAAHAHTHPAMALHPSAVLCVASQPWDWMQATFGGAKSEEAAH
jgi:hypothetical protein